MEVFIHNTEEMDAFAREIVQSITQKRLEENEVNKVKGASIIGLSGELGAGKTTFAKSFARALNIFEPIPSPTFVLARFYNIPDNPDNPDSHESHESHEFARLVHIDAYRIEDTAELEVLDWTGLQADAKNLILVEWPENMKQLFPSNVQMLSFSVVDQTTRKVRTYL